MTIPKLTRRNFLKISGLGALGFKVASLLACQKTPYINPQERSKIEHNILKLLQDIKSNKNSIEINYAGKKLRLGIDNVAIFISITSFFFFSRNPLPSLHIPLCNPDK